VISNVITLKLPPWFTYNMNARDNTFDSRPQQSEFDPYGGCLDAQHAWKNFGGLSVRKAYAKFCTLPEYYQEDFMFMGGVAFQYYFPVIEQYVLESHADSSNEYEVDAMWILAHCIKQQFDIPNTQAVESIRMQAQDLAAHVRDNLSQYCTDPIEQQRVDSAWAELHSKLTQNNNA